MGDPRNPTHWVSWRNKIAHHMVSHADHMSCADQMYHMMCADHMMCAGHMMSHVDRMMCADHMMSHVAHMMCTGHMMSHAGISLPPAVSKDLPACVCLCGSEPWSPVVCWDRGDQLQ